VAADGVPGRLKRFARATDDSCFYEVGEQITRRTHDHRAPIVQCAVGEVGITLGLRSVIIVSEKPVDEIFHVAIAVDRIQHARELIDLLPAEVEGFVPHVFQTVAAARAGEDAK
jgi:hypothetical protein